MKLVTNLSLTELYSPPNPEYLDSHEASDISAAATIHSLPLGNSRIVLTTAIVGLAWALRCQYTGKTARWTSEEAWLHFSQRNAGVPFILSAPKSSGAHLAHIQRIMGGSIKFDSQFHPWRSSKMSKVILPHLHMPSWLVQGKLELKAIGCEV